MFKVTITLVLLLLLAVCLLGTAAPAGQVSTVTADRQLQSLSGETDNAASMALANASTARLDLFSESGG